MSESFKIGEQTAVVGWDFQKTCLDSPSMEIIGRSHLSSGEASADL